MATTGGAGAQKRFIHGLIEQSRERVVQVRAGQSLVEVLESASPTRRHLHPQQQHKQQQQQQEEERSNPHGRREDGAMLPDMKIVYEARRHASTAVVKSGDAPSDVSALRTNLRRRGVLAATSTASAVAPPPVASDPLHASAAHHRQRRGQYHERAAEEEVSSAKFREYMNSKSAQVETLRANDRRKALAGPTGKLVAQLAATTAQHQQQLEKHPVAAGVAHTLAVLKAKNMLLSLKRRPATPKSPNAQDLANMKNTHSAFLDFKKSSEERDHRKHARMLYVLRWLLLHHGWLVDTGTCLVYLSSRSTPGFSARTRATRRSGHRSTLATRSASSPRRPICR